MEKKIMGANLTEIRRQCEADVLKYDSNAPIRCFETVEPCIEGGRKILEDDELKLFFNEILTGRNSNG